MKNIFENTNITINSNLKKIDGYVVFAEKIAKATKMVAKLDEITLEKLRNDAHKKQ